MYWTHVVVWKLRGSPISPVGTAASLLGDLGWCGLQRSELLVAADSQAPPFSTWLTRAQVVERGWLTHFNIIEVGMTIVIRLLTHLTASISLVMTMVVGMFQDLRAEPLAGSARAARPGWSRCRFQSWTMRMY